MKQIIEEKPSVAQAIAPVLGAMAQKVHNKFLSPGSSGQTKTASFQKPPYISWLTCEV